MKLSRIYKLIYLCVLLLAGYVVSGQQRALSVLPVPVTFAKYDVLDSSHKPHKPLLQAAVPLFTPALSALTVQTVIEPDYYTRHLGYFCKKELQFEKITALPLRFRLGTLEYVNRLEGK